MSNEAAKPKPPKYRRLNGAINGPQMSALVDKLADGLEGVEKLHAPAEASSATAMWKAINEIKDRLKGLEDLATKTPA